jgi:hypothetical protein
MAQIRGRGNASDIHIGPSAPALEIKPGCIADHRVCSQ